MITIVGIGIGLVIVGGALSVAPVLLNLRKSWMTVAGGVMLIAGFFCVASDMATASL